jgi:hypothetical protein
MRGLKRLLKLPRAERRVLFEAVITIFVVRTMLRYLPLPDVQRSLAGFFMKWRSSSSCADARIVWTIQRAACSLADSNCLVQALAGQALLARYGYQSLLIIGVAKAVGDEKERSDRFAAHAWVTRKDKVVIGGQETANYTALLNLGSQGKFSFLETGVMSSLQL